MNKRLQHLNIAVLATDGFEQSELTEPIAAFKKEGASVSIIAPSPKGGKIRGWKEKDWGKDVQVDLDLDEAEPANFDALFLPGGVMNPDRLRMIPEAVEFVRTFSRDHKPIAAICHGPQTLIETDAVRGKTVTSWPSLKTDLKNAGAVWVDQEVVEDGNMVTSRKPADIPAFNAKAISVFEQALAASR